MDMSNVSVVERKLNIQAQDRCYVVTGTLHLRGSLPRMLHVSDLLQDLPRCRYILDSSRLDFAEVIVSFDACQVEYNRESVIDAIQGR